MNLKEEKKKLKLIKFVLIIMEKSLAATSDRGNIHIWAMGSLIKKMKERNEIKEDDNIITVDIINNNNININEISNVNQDDLPENKSSIFKRFFVVKGEWSFVQVRLDDQKMYL